VLLKILEEWALGLQRLFGVLGHEIEALSNVDDDDDDEKCRDRLFLDD
jgi:hypothetical protein